MAYVWFYVRLVRRPDYRYLSLQWFIEFPISAVKRIPGTVRNPLGPVGKKITGGIRTGGSMYMRHFL